MKRLLPVLVIAVFGLYAACDDGGSSNPNPTDVVTPDNGGGETTPPVDTIGPEPDQVCTPACEGKVCGDDGCNGTCGTCDAGTKCSDDQSQCEPDCTPACDGKVCGDDGCNGTCGTCDAGTTCSADQTQCEPDGCVPDACDAAWECGDDSCDTVGGCGVCEDGYLCNADHLCEAEVCVPDTCDAAWECGDDSCGTVGGCGTCAVGFVCTDEHLCVDETQCECDPAFECGADSCGVADACGVCGDGMTCDDATHTCMEVQYGPSSFVNYLYLPYAEGDEPCCFDFTGDGNIDNGVANLIGMLGSFLGDTDPNAMIVQAIAEGQIAVLFEFMDVTDWVNMDAFPMNFYLGQDADDDYTDNLDAENGGDFLISPQSLDENGDPLVTFDGMEIADSVMAGGPAQFILDIPISEGIIIHAVIDGAMVDGTITEDAGKVWINDGKLGGYVAKQVIAEGLNNYIASSCDCLGLSGPLVDIPNNTCATDGTPDACVDDQKTCGDIYGYCSMALPFIDMVLDVDADGDGTPDSISIGAQFATIPAAITGIGTDEPTPAP